MTPLDSALQAALADPEAQKKFYNVFLNSEIFVPLQETSIPESGEARTTRQETFTPLLIAAQDKAYLPMFDSLARLQAWAKREVRFISLPGYALLEGLEGNVHLILNLGTDHVKEFFLDEIQWLKDLVAVNKPQIAKYQGGSRIRILPKPIPKGLGESLIERFKKNPEVEAAYLVQIQLPDHPEKNPHWLLVLKMAKDLESAFNGIAEDLAQTLQASLGPDDFLDILPYAGEELEETVVRQAQPFYRTEKPNK